MIKAPHLHDDSDHRIGHGVGQAAGLPFQGQLAGAPRGRGVGQGDDVANAQHVAVGAAGHAAQVRRRAALRPLEHHLQRQPHLHARTRARAWLAAAG